MSERGAGVCRNNGLYAPTVCEWVGGEGKKIPTDTMFGLWSLQQRGQRTYHVALDGRVRIKHVYVTRSCAVKH
jgi:hypothetical protein